jgi:hypothetical protein
VRHASFPPRRSVKLYVLTYTKTLKHFLLQAIICQSDEEYDETDWEDLEDLDVHLEEGPSEAAGDRFFGIKCAFYGGLCRGLCVSKHLTLSNL